MGWHNVKKHYNIGHIVQRCGQEIHIGSPYISNILVISSTGELVKRYDGFNESLRRYQQEMDAYPATLQSLVITPDQFEHSITVYTFCGGDIIEAKCEATGWPNVTHEGELMYDNRFSPDKEKVIAWAKQDAAIGAHHLQRSVAEAEKHLQDLRNRQAACQASLAKLEGAYPSVSQGPSPM